MRDGLVRVLRSPAPAITVMLAVLLGLLLSATEPAGRAHAQSGTLYILTLADNGSTVSVQVGDSIELKLTSGDFYNWDFQISNPGILRRPPIALVRGVQGFWNVVAPGQTTIMATGTPQCYPQCLAPSIAFSVTVVAQQSGPPGTPVTVNYAAGWNLVGVPANTTFPIDVYSWDPAAGRYTVVSSGTPLRAGHGYWAFFSSPASVTLAAGGAQPAQITAPPGSWVMAGNPGASQAARVSGADAVYTWDPARGTYTATAVVDPGHGGWAYSAAGGTITVTPLAPPAPPSTQ